MPTKLSVLRAMPFSTIKPLLDDPESVEVQGKAMALLRNLVHGKADAIDAVMSWSGGKLMDVVRHTLSACVEAAEMRHEVTEQALYIVCNLAAGEERHKVRHGRGPQRPCGFICCQLGSRSWRRNMLHR